MVRYPLFWSVFKELLLSPGTKDTTFTREDSGRRNPTNTEKNHHPKLSYFWPIGKEKGTGFTSRQYTTVHFPHSLASFLWRRCARHTVQRRWPKEEEEEASILKFTVGGQVCGWMRQGFPEEQNRQNVHTL